MIHRATVATIGLLLCACGGDPPEYVRPVPATSQLYYGEDPVFTDPIERVIESDDGLRQVWERIEQTVAAPARMPTNIDFERRMVLVVGVGQRRAGDRLRVDSVSVRAEQYRVFYTVVEDCFEGAPPVYPLQIVEAERSEYPVLFVDGTEMKPGCEA
jgi:hypothetical protein